ncbi:ArnT family glycosyltransferase [Neolewinella sp.]|uniref:ArnT family glycosyltransferase n=1 Tax=Neolewinella sp. TaxID=2993543 RepID=UPI003B5210EB
MSEYIDVQELSARLAVAALPGLVSVYLFFARSCTTPALTLLIVSSFLLHLTMAAADPFLHPWDERFHALVAKHMMAEPFRPMLRLDPILPYDLEAWCCNHIWVHKQPLFLWQMVLSMKVFGVSEVAVRLPSAVMGALGTLLVYGIGRYWSKSREVGFTAALLFGFSRYHLELTAGRYNLDHNDVAFAFYVTAGI